MGVSSDEEGFTNDPIEIVSWNYQPLSRKYGPPKHSKHQSLINPAIRHDWLQRVKQQQQQQHDLSIVFNNWDGEDVNYIENNLSFSSDFEAGNLELACRLRTGHYSLYMRPDTNTKAHFQWFYFRVHVRKGQRVVKFVIKNFIKATMLYNKGLRPYARALKNVDHHEWKQLKTQSKFYQDENTQYYNLEFTYLFAYDDDEVEFSSQPPYTFTHLQQLLPTLSCKKLHAGKTLMGRKIPYLLFDAVKETKVVAFVIGRQHPGEAVGSWMMEGFLKALTQSKEKCCEWITWVVIPMVNIDGVVLGNNRTGVLGHDFNRNWSSEESYLGKSARLYPEISGILNLIKTYRKNYPKKIKLFLDLHGHSSQPNVFTYGPFHDKTSEYYFQSRLFPELLAQRNDNFSLDQCSYVMKPNKRKTARAVAFRNFGIPFTYTIESTFGVMRDKQVLVEDFIKIGEDVLKVSNDFLSMTCLGNQKSIIEEIRCKYQNIEDEISEYDSASATSEDDSDRNQIEEMLLEDAHDLPKKSHRLQHRYTQKSQTPQKEKLGLSLPKSLHFTKQTANIVPKNQQRMRFNTEQEITCRKGKTEKTCLLPQINKKLYEEKKVQKNKKKKLSFQQSFFTEEQLKRNLKVQQIQKRLFKLRNSKIGKKILVINAYHI